MTEQEARRVISQQCEGFLLPEIVLPFDKPEFAGCTVADVMADPQKFVGATLADPIEGVEYGRCCAKVMLHDGKPWINSFAHGGTKYQLRQYSPLEHMNERYAVVQIGGKMRVAYFEPSPAFEGVETFVYSGKSNFISLMENDRVQVTGQDGAIRYVGIGKWWLGKADRRQYARVVFDPANEDKDALNLWRGFSCEPAEGDCGLYLQHLRENICRGEAGHYEYLL